jgi:hypothetical protein
MFLSKITSILELVVRTNSTVCYNEPYKDALTVEFCDMSLFDQLDKINSMVGIDMKKHMENIKANEAKNQSFNTHKLFEPEELSGNFLIN